MPRKRHNLSRADRLRAERQLDDARRRLAEQKKKREEVTTDDATKAKGR
jgi:hypothetical protein